MRTPWIAVTLLTVLPLAAALPLALPPAAATAAAPVEPKPADSRLRDAVARHALATVADRRWFHENPELGNREVKTSARIAAVLRQLGLEVEHPVGLTGVVGLLDSGRPGPTVALRGEMDALPVTEAEDSGNPVRSLSPGVMHACGHDIHMASALGAARVLADLKDSLRGRVLFVFQPAEEGVAPEERRKAREATGSDKLGADRLVNVDRIFDRYHVQAVFGLHGFPEMPAGAIGLAPEYAMAAADSFEIAIRGFSAHAGQSPWTGSDVLHIAAGVVLDLHALPARQTDPRNPKVVSVSMLDCTDGRTNILCRTARLSGTVRAFRPEDRAFLKQGIERTLDAAVKARDPKAGRCRGGDSGDHLCWEIVSYEDDGLPVRQNVPLLDWSAGVLEAELGAGRVVRGPASLGAEDFAFYCEKAPCVFLGLGTAPPGGTGGLHTPRYAPSEESIPIGMRVLAALAARWLEQR
jgi:amidohydrolase